MKRLSLLGALTALLFVVPAGAVEWLNGCQTGATTTTVAAGGFACANPTSNTDDTEIIFVGNCENFDVFQHDDKNGAGTASLVEGTLELCPDPSLTGSAADNGCGENFDGLGVTALSGDDSIVAATGVWARIEAGGVNTNPTQTLWVIRCAQPSGG